MEYGTYRAVLFRLNILCGIMAIVQIAVSLWFYILLYGRRIVDRTLPTISALEVENEEANRFEVITNVWNLNGAILLLGIAAILIFATVVSTVRAIQNVDLYGAIRYLWLILWVIPLLVRYAE
jgi:hypothetical protein